MLCMGVLALDFDTTSHSTSQIGLELIAICLSFESAESQAWAAMPGFKEVFLFVYIGFHYDIFIHTHTQARTIIDLSCPLPLPLSLLIPRWSPFYLGDFFEGNHFIVLFSGLHSSLCTQVPLWNVLLYLKNVLHTSFVV